MCVCVGLSVLSVLFKRTPPIPYEVAKDTVTDALMPGSECGEAQRMRGLAEQKRNNKVKKKT